ncbi:MAG: hypothetical protein AAF368_06070 [Planctomycetota bacterium]
MSTNLQSSPTSPNPGLSGKQKVGWVLTALGGFLLLWGVLGFTSSSIGGPPQQREFASRRTYNQIKRASHNALPWMMLRGFSGLALLMVGGRLRRRQDSEEELADSSFEGSKK